MSMGFCPAPHTTRDQVWLGVGVAAGICIARYLSKQSIKKEECTVSIKPPTRVFKLCIASELEKFKATGRIESGLDAADGFCHLSDRTAPPKVASLFFKGATDLHLLELDANKFLNPVHWFVGVMGDTPPDASTRATAGKTAVHYLMADGCVHVYSDLGVSFGAVVREAKVPLGDDGVHVFPEWM
mmetsp:Transcript_91119/g.174757  ORF Transcript_91119/g.174757 Transcript_91119/m.174757 type:complete len:185 (+) Transcript_91119:68-622(+)